MMTHTERVLADVANANLPNTPCRRLAEIEARNSDRLAEVRVLVDRLDEIAAETRATGDVLSVLADGCRQDDLGSAGPYQPLADITGHNELWNLLHLELADRLHRWR